MKTLVIAKYKEDISWTNEVKDFNIIIFDKLDDKDLPNIGREAHTYLHFIVNNYDNLEGVYVFSQGNPFDHCQNFLEEIKNTDVEHKPLGRIYTDDNKGYPHHTGLDIKGFWNTYIDDECPEIFTFTAGAIFIISADKLKMYPKSFYEKLLQGSIEFPQGAWILERIWSTLWY